MQVCQNNLKNREFVQEAPQNLRSERAPLAHEQEPSWKTVVFDFFKQLPNSENQRLPSFQMPNIAALYRNNLKNRLLGAQASAFTSWITSCKFFANTASALP